MKIINQFQKQEKNLKQIAGSLRVVEQSVQRDSLFWPKLKNGDANFFRASELYLKAESGINEATLTEQLLREDFRTLGKNEKLQNLFSNQGIFPRQTKAIHAGFNESIFKH